MKEEITKIQAVMSMPRLAFTDNMFRTISVFPPLGIAFDKGSGVFWGQILTRLIERHLGDDTEYVITLDYDTWFNKEHVIRLCQLMAENPDVDAIIPVQTKRENEIPMFSIIDKDGKNVKEALVSEFDKELVQVASGHFGLTIFRVEALKRMQKPWFLGIPDDDGSWGDGRIDEDIHFWKQFMASGLKACLAPDINIIHLELQGTAPGTAANGFKPVSVSMTDLDNGIVPANCTPQVEMLK